MNCYRGNRCWRRNEHHDIQRLRHCFLVVEHSASIVARLISLIWKRSLPKTVDNYNSQLAHNVGRSRMDAFFKVSSYTVDTKDLMCLKSVLAWRDRIGLRMQRTADDCLPLTMVHKLMQRRKRIHELMTNVMTHDLHKNENGHESSLLSLLHENPPFCRCWKKRKE